MDLPDLLSPERVACRRELSSKKRALEELSTLLFAGLELPEEPDSRDAEAEETRDSRTSRLSRAVKRTRRDKDRHDQTAEIRNAQFILDGLIERERLGSTGLGYGVALPHSRCPVDEPMAALLTLEEGVDFNAADGETVDLIVGLLVPTECTGTHLEILANLATRLSQPAFRESLRQCHSDSELLAAARVPIQDTAANTDTSTDP